MTVGWQHGAVAFSRVLESSPSHGGIARCFLSAFSRVLGESSRGHGGIERCFLSFIDDDSDGQMYTHGIMVLLL